MAASARFELKLYPLNGEFMASIDVDKSDNKFKAKIQTIVILDRSGSMGNYVEKVISDILPKFFAKLSYEPSQCVYLILFDDKSVVYRMWVREFDKTRKTCGGGTIMAPAVNELGNLFTSFDSNELVRVLTISDGEIEDSAQVASNGAQVTKLLATKNLRVNSQAVRLFTSGSQPDTTALCSVLRFNNSVHTKLVDIQATSRYDEIADEMAALFSSDELTNAMTMTADSSLFQNFPWESETSDKMNIFPGQNVFWMKKIPEKVQIGDETVQISMQESLSLTKFHSLLEDKIAFIVDHLKILKIVGTSEAAKIVSEAFEYFANMEKLLGEAVSDSSLLDSKNLQHRIRILKKASTQQKKFTNILAMIANDENVSQLNSAQKADYLREVDVNKTSRGLAKRAAKEGFDFDETARKEVREMAKHFDEIADIDDRDHLVSFYSQDTTLGGIRCLVDLVKDDSIDLFNVNAILQLLNIVGVACNGPIGNYPDAMTWKVDEIFLGCNVSLSDVLVAFTQSEGQGLKAPAFGEEITNVIPIFDDPRIGNFLKKHAPSLLEYTFSVGMRRVIADVPMTIGYTICAGIIRMVHELNQNKSSLHLKVFEQFVTTFDKFVGKYFDHVKALVKKQNDEKLSFYIGNNGISNFISPLFRLYKENDEEKLKLVPSTLRSLYSHETWQGIRRAYKNKEHSEDIARDMLHKLLGIDFEKNKTPLRDLFEAEPEISEIYFYDKPNIDVDYLMELFAPLQYIQNLALIPKLLQAVANNSSDSIREFPAFSVQNVLDALEINYSNKLFFFFNAFQALAYTTSASRIDTEMEVMKVVDVKQEKHARKNVRKYIKNQFKSFYLSELSNKKKLESEKMGTEIVGKILASSSYDEMISIWRYGITKNETVYKIANSSSKGFDVLYDKLCDVSLAVSERENIFKVLLLGVDDENLPVWNNGGVWFMPDIRKVRLDYLKFFDEEKWNEILRSYKARQHHIYREAVNRNGHGNSKPSFWAMGYKTLGEFHDSVTQETFDEYCKIHVTCCGVKFLTRKLS